MKSKEDIWWNHITALFPENDIKAAVLPAMEEYAKEVAIDFCLKVCGELKFPNDKTSYDKKSNEAFLMAFPATIEKRFEKFLKEKQ